MGLDGVGRADKRRVAHNRHGLQAGVAEAFDRERAKAFRQREAVRADQQAVVAEGGRVGAQRLEQLHLHAGIRHMIFAAQDVRDAEVDVVDDAREGVEGGAVGADQNRVGQGADIHRLVAADQVVPRHDGGDRLQHILGDAHLVGVGEAEAPVRTAALGLQELDVLGGEAEGGAVIDRRQAARELALALAVEFVLGFETRVEPLGSAELLGDLLVACRAIRLALLAIPGKAQPVRSSRMPSAKTPEERSLSVSSRRKRKLPPVLRANR